MRVGGHAAVTWTESTGAGTERVFRLPAPLRDQVPSHDGLVVAIDSLDKTARTVFTYGAGAYELTTVVRFADDPQGLLDLVRAGAENTTLTLYPDVTDSGVSHTVNLVAPVNAKALERDAQTAVWGDMQVTLRFRRTDQGVFAAAWHKDELFRYQAGGRLDEATVARASSASYVAKGYGTGAYASSNTARVTWIRPSSTDVTRPEPALRLERARTNLITESSDLAQWGLPAGVTRTSAQADPFGGSNAWLLTSTSTGSANAIQTTGTAGASTIGVVSCWLQQVSTNDPPIGTLVQLDESTNTANDQINATVTWSSGQPSVAFTAGAQATTPDPYISGWWRFGWRSTGNLVSGRAYGFRVTPAKGTTSTGSVRFFGAQFEQ